MQQTVLVEEESVTITLPIFPLSMFSADSSMCVLVMANASQLVSINSENQHSTLGSHSSGCVSLDVYSTDPAMRLYAELEQEDRQARCYVFLNQTVTVFQAPEQAGGERFWDLGYLMPGTAHFIEINCVSS